VMQDAGRASGNVDDGPENAADGEAREARRLRGWFWRRSPLGACLPGCSHGQHSKVDLARRPGHNLEGVIPFVSICVGDGSGAKAPRGRA